MIEGFRNNEDIHKSTASKVFNIPLSEVTKEQRSHAKTVNFGIIYGVSAFGLSNQTSLSRSESASLIDQYYQPKTRVIPQKDTSVFLRRNNFAPISRKRSHNSTGYCSR